jgi:hypothetical protein
MREATSAAVKKLTNQSLAQVILAGTAAKSHGQVIAVLIRLAFQLVDDLSTLLVKGQRTPFINFTLFTARKVSFNRFHIALEQYGP